YNAVAGAVCIAYTAGTVLKSGLQRAQGACAVWRVETPGDFLQPPLQIVEEAAPLLDGVLLTPLHKFCQMGESVFKTAEEMVCIRCRRNGVEPFGNARDVRGKPLHRLLGNFDAPGDLVHPLRERIEAFHDQAAGAVLHHLVYLAGEGTDARLDPLTRRNIEAGGV